MTRRLLGLTTALLLSCTAAHAALPPQYQNQKDLRVIFDYLVEHDDVMASLRSIDMDNMIVHYGWQEHCQLRFKRKQVSRPEGWVGPAEDLIPGERVCTASTQ